MLTGTCHVISLLQIECTKCHKTCHGACYNILAPCLESMRQSFVCIACSANSSSTAQDDTSTISTDSLNPARLSQLALWRRCLIKLEGSKVICYRDFRKLVGRCGVHSTCLQCAIPPQTVTTAIAATATAA